MPKIKSLAVGIGGFLFMLVLTMVVLRLLTKAPVVGGVAQKVENLAQTGSPG